MSKYDRMTDEQLLCDYKNGNQEIMDYLMVKYKSMVRKKARAMYLLGGENEDLIQEGMIGLIKAVRDFDVTQKTSFSSFAELCVTRQIITAIKTATRQKHIPLNTYISLSKPIYEDESDRTLLDTVVGITITDPESLVIGKEEVEKIESAINSVLSELELEVLNSYLDGKSYQEIACDLDREAKSIDNALQRVKRKLEKCLNIK